MKILLRTLSIGLLLVIGALAFIYFSPDYSLFFVRSESMKPNINMGDVVITGPIRGPFSSELKPGTIITYKMNKGLVTHRIIAINDIWTVITQGDNAEDPDPRPIAITDITGIYILKIPYIGYLTSFVRTRVGWWLTIIVPTMMLLSFIIIDIIKEALKKA